VGFSLGGPSPEVDIGTYMYEIEMFINEFLGFVNT
jgi:hypothetical protein